MGLARATMSDHGVLLKMQLSEGLPHIFGDRVQLQQVILMDCALRLRHGN